MHRADVSKTKAAVPCADRRNTPSLEPGNRSRRHERTIYAAGFERLVGAEGFEPTTYSV